MKTIKKVPISIQEVEYIPNKKDMEFGILYYSEKYNACNHLCLCGCGHECYLLILPNEWSLINDNGKPTIKPSILQVFKCESHYIITNGIANFV